MTNQQGPTETTKPSHAKKQVHWMAPVVIGMLMTTLAPNATGLDTTGAVPYVGIVAKETNTGGFAALFMGFGEVSVEGLAGSLPDGTVDSVEITSLDSTGGTVDHQSWTNAAYTDGVLMLPLNALTKGVRYRAEAVEGTVTSNIELGVTSLGAVSFYVAPQTVADCRWDTPPWPYDGAYTDGNTDDDLDREVNPETTATVNKESGTGAVSARSGSNYNSWQTAESIVWTHGMSASGSYQMGGTAAADNMAVATGTWPAQPTYRHALAGLWMGLWIWNGSDWETAKVLALDTVETYWAGISRAGGYSRSIYEILDPDYTYYGGLLAFALAETGSTSQAAASVSGASFTGFNWCPSS